MSESGSIMNRGLAIEAPPRSTKAGGRMGRRARLSLLSAHIAISVGLLGDSAGFLAVAVRHATSHDPAFVESSVDLLSMFALWFGIPLSFLALLSGLLLGLGTRWGVLRYPWIVLKLGLIASVIVVGALVLRPVLFGNQIGDAALVMGAGWDVLALATATGLGVFKPGRAFRGRGSR